MGHPARRGDDAGEADAILPYAFREQRANVFQQAVRLREHIAFVQDTPAIVDAGSAADIDMTVTQAHTPFESHSIIASRAQMAEGLEVGLVGFDNVRAAEEIHRHHGGTASVGAAYPSAGYIMIHQAFFGEHIVAGLHHPRVVGIDVAHVYPCANAVRLEFEAHRADDVQILPEEQACLCVGILARRLGLRQTYGMEDVSFRLIACAHQRRDAASVKGRLLHDGDILSTSSKGSICVT